jgi:glycine betaine/proline transport system substrate-binding protein
MDLGGVTSKRVAALVAVAAIGLSACSSAATPAASSGAASAAPGGSAAAAAGAPCGTVNIADNAWVGYEADVAVIAYILKNELGCTVNIKQLSEQISWQGFPTGEVDAILENWGHDDLAKQYITDQ